MSEQLTLHKPERNTFYIALINLVHYLLNIFSHLFKSEGIPVTGRGVYESSETSRLPHFLDSRLTDGG
jgi:hypothetical protein